MRIISGLLCLLLAFAAGPAFAADLSATELLSVAQPRPGLCLVLGITDVAFLTTLQQQGRFLVHAISEEPAAVELAQNALCTTNQYGPVWLEERAYDAPLPYAENLVNFVVVGKNIGVPPEEVMRVLQPYGVVAVDAGEGYGILRKPYPTEMDEWTHPRHGVDNNAVSTDTAVGPPRRIRWITGPLNTAGELVTARGRDFFGDVTARDAFNGLFLWESNKAAYWNVRPVVNGDRLYVVAEQEVRALDAATGETVQRYPEAGFAKELYVTDDTLVAVNGDFVIAVDIESGKQLWKRNAPEANCITIGDGSLFLCEGNPKRGEARRVFRLDLRTSEVAWWHREPVNKPDPTDLAWLANAAWCTYADGLLIFETSSFNDFPEGNAIHVLDAKDGSLRWSHIFDPSQYHSKQARALYVDGKVYVLEDRACTALDATTGEQLSQFETGFGHCFPPVATTKYFLSGEMSLHDFETGDVDTQHIAKGSCSRYAGLVPANGLLNISPKGCVCWPMLNGYNALAPAGGGPVRDDFFLEKGPVFEKSGLSQAERGNEQEQDCPDFSTWPCYRADGMRSGATTKRIAAKQILWETAVGPRPENAFMKDWLDNPFARGPLTQATTGQGLVFVARPDAHEIVALNQQTGAPQWTFIASGRVDGPPTYYNGLCLFGSRNGYVYAVRASDGDLAWRLRMAGNDERIVTFGQVESPWPLTGSILVQDGIAYAAAGRQYLADGGIRIAAIRPETGDVMWKSRVNTLTPEYHYYANSGVEFDSFDLMNNDGDFVSMSRWHFDKQDGTQSVTPKEGFVRHGDVIVPRGFYTYGTRMARGGDKRADLRPLLVFAGNTVFGCTPDMKSIFRKDFASDAIESFDMEWYRVAELNKQVAEGGPATRTERIALDPAWTKPIADAPIAAMALTGDLLHVVDESGVLYTINTEMGAVLQTLSVAKPVWDGLAASDDKLLLSCADGHLLALGE